MRYKNVESIIEYVESLPIEQLRYVCVNCLKELIGTEEIIFPDPDTLDENDDSHPY